MGKYLMGLFFVLIALFLIHSLFTQTMPGVDGVGTQINEDIKNVYTGP